jgi:gamma-glutamyltranspeptidase / glutathione hydrolase
MRKITVTLAILSACQAIGSPHYRGGAAATPHPVATRAAISMLDQGGNAVDAVVAAALAGAVVDPQSSGLGGGGFALVHDANGERALDFREVAPRAARRDMYLKDGKVDPALSLDGILSVAVPGAAKGYVELHRKYGKLPLSKVAAPAIAAAKKGFVVSPSTHDDLKEREKCLAADPEAARIFLSKDKTALPPGALLVQSDLARSLETLAKEGDAPFHTGKIAQAIVETMKSKGGLVTRDDLAGFKTRERAPLEGSYRGHRVVTMPPPSAGGLVLLQTLGVLERKTPAGIATREPAALHIYLEALKRSFLDRFRYLGDPAFAPAPMERLLSKENLDALAAAIDPRRATPASELMKPKDAAAAAADAGMRPRHTSHFSVIDKDGNAAAVTTTINWTFGSCVVAKGTGILLNDEMDDFTAAPDAPNVFHLIQGEANIIAPGKIPLSSMTPTLVFQQGRPKEVMLAVGSPGGSRIPTTVLQVMSQIIDGKRDVAEAVALGKLHHQLSPDTVRIDPLALDPRTIAALEALGHVMNRTERWGNVQVVMVDPASGMRTAASDPSVDGLALGQE